MVRTSWLLRHARGGVTLQKGAFCRRLGEHAGRVCREGTACWNAAKPTVPIARGESVSSAPQGGRKALKGDCKSGSPYGPQCSAHRGFSFRCFLVGPQDHRLAVPWELSLFAQGFGSVAVKGCKAQLGLCGRAFAIEALPAEQPADRTVAQCAIAVIKEDGG